MKKERKLIIAGNWKMNYSTTRQSGSMTGSDYDFPLNNWSRKSTASKISAKIDREDKTVDPEKVMRAVFKVLTQHISEGEIEDVEHLLPKSLQESGCRERLT